MRRRLLTQVKQTFAFIALISCGALVAAQSSIKDINAVIAAGKFDGNTYRNAYFGLDVTATGAQPKPGEVVNIAGKRARLVEILSASKEIDKVYSFSILVDSLQNYPQLHSSEQYVRSVRHNLEKEGVETIREEFPIQIAGKPFTGALLRVPGGRSPHVRGMYSAFLNGYILSFDITSSDERLVQERLSKFVKFTSQSN